MAEKSIPPNQPDAAGPETDVSNLFARAIALEDDPNNQLQAIALYERVLDLDPDHPAAHINLGTLNYNRQNYTAAEHHYRSAIKIDTYFVKANAAFSQKSFGLHANGTGAGTVYLDFVHGLATG